MPKEVCKDCGMILPADTSVCSVCGFDNNIKDLDSTPFVDYSINIREEIAPENYPGF